MRAVRVGARALRTLSAEDVNVITHRLEGAAFDLVIATNVLLYYGAFEQALALANIGAMLRDGGLLLTNTAPPEVRAVPLARVGSLRTLYTDDGAGDEMLWYRRGVPAPRMP
jgi:hypothetical protein